MSQELEILKEVGRRLADAKIAYMVTGSVAANFYAVPRMTRDIDIVIEVFQEHLRKLMNLFKDDFYIDQESVAEAIDQRGLFNIIHNEHVFKVDFIIRKDMPYRKLEFERKRSIDLEGQKIWVVSPEDLVLSKLDWAKDSLSDMQLKDVKNLLGTVRDLDLAYLDKWTQELGLNAIFQKAKL